MTMHAKPEADAPEVTLDNRPWGRFEQYTLNEPTTVKVITVAPGHRLSLQRHTGRDEWWTILDGELVVQVDNEERAARRGDRVWIRRGQLHRAQNTSSREASLLEIAFGHFDEDDIERLDDDYSR
jgi:mannose-6-phosphate isomerase-like protein (cupin superfamily)